MISAHALERDVQSRRHAQRAFEERFTTATTSGLDTEGDVGEVGKEVKIRATLLEAQISLLRRSALLLNTTTQGPTLESLSASAPPTSAGGASGAQGNAADGPGGGAGGDADGEAAGATGGGGQVRRKLELLQAYRSGDVQVRPPADRVGRRRPGCCT